MREVVVAGAAAAGKTTVCNALTPWLQAHRWGRGLRLLDTPGLDDWPAADPGQRRLQVQAIHRLQTVPLFLHVVDASRTGAVGEAAAVDRELAVWGRNKPGYAVLATHMDGPWAATGLRVIQRALNPYRLIPVVAPAAQGLGAICYFLRRQA